MLPPMRSYGYYLGIPCLALFEPVVYLLTGVHIKKNVFAKNKVKSLCLMYFFF